MDFLSWLKITMVVAVDAALFSLLYFCVAFVKLQRRKNEFKRMHQELAPGDSVRINHGIEGVVKSVDAEVAILELNKGILVTCSRYALTLTKEGK